MFFASSQIVVKKLKTLGQRDRWGWGLKYQGGIFVGGLVPHCIHERTDVFAFICSITKSQKFEASMFTTLRHLMPWHNQCNLNVTMYQCHKSHNSILNSQLGYWLRIRASMANGCGPVLGQLKTGAH